MTGKGSLRAATRSSALAQWQARHVASLLAPFGVELELVLVDTVGDRVQDVPLHQVGGQGVFTKEVQAAVLDGRADIAVHSLKDLPSSVELAPVGLVLASVPARGEHRDALVGSTLAGLPDGGHVATGSVRRRAQLAALRPDLRFSDLRGNVPTRLEKAKGFDAVVLAAAGLQRLDRADAIAALLPVDVMTPQVGQGALGIECREDDERTRQLLAGLEDPVARRAVDAERAFLAALGSGCDLPVGAHCDGATVTGVIAALDGSKVVRDAVPLADPVATGAALAAHLLDDLGARALLP